MSVGIVIWDSEGLVMVSSIHQIAMNYSLQVAKAIAIYLGLHLALVTGFTNVVARSDVQVIVNWIHEDREFFFEVGLILEDIKLVLPGCFAYVNVSFVPRNTNHSTLFS